MEHLCGIPEGDVDGEQIGLGAVAAARRRGHEEVEQHRLEAGAGDEHVAAGAEARQQRLGHERREHRGERGVDGVAAFAQHLRTGRRRQRVPGGNDSPRRPAHVLRRQRR